MTATLQSAKPMLESSIRRAFEKVNREGAKDGSDPEANIRALSHEIANAIHEYVASAAVDITLVVSTVPPGVGVTTASAAGPGAGTTVTPGVAQHAGYGKLL